MQHDSLKSTTFLSVNFNLVKSSITLFDWYIWSELKHPSASMSNPKTAPFLFIVRREPVSAYVVRYLLVRVKVNGHLLSISWATSRMNVVFDETISKSSPPTHAYRAYRETRVDRTPSVVEAAALLAPTPPLPFSLYLYWSIEDQILPVPSQNLIS